MGILVVAHDPAWAALFEQVENDLRHALVGVPVEAIEHVGSTSVPGLAAKPVLDIDILTAHAHIPAAIKALEHVGYIHEGDLGVEGREAFAAPDSHPARHVYLGPRDNLHVRNHLAVRDVLRARPDLRDEYGQVKMHHVSDPGMDIDTYVAGKSAILQKVLAESDLSVEERASILLLNDPDATGNSASG